MPLSVLLSSPSDNPAADLHRWLTDAGFIVRDHVLGSTPAVEFASFAVAVLDMGTKTDAAVSQTRRWRAELGDEILPVAWVLPEPSAEETVRGLEAGADVVLARPLEQGVFLAQIRAAARTRATSNRVATRASEARLLGEQLQKAYAQLDREHKASRRIHQMVLPETLPRLGPVRFTVCHRPRSRIGGDFYDVRVLDENHVGFFLGDVIGAPTGGSLLGVFVMQSVVMREVEGDGYRIVGPGEFLARVNRELLGLDDTPLVAMLAGTLDARTGELKLARAGLLAPVHFPAEGKPEAWVIPGPFLGTADTSYPTHAARLRPGDKLILRTDGTRPEGDPGSGADERLVALLTQHHHLSGQGFVDAVARELLTQVRHADDFTLLCVEMS